MKNQLFLIALLIIGANNNLCASMSNSYSVSTQSLVFSASPGVPIIDTIPYPWSKVDLTDEEMKPFIPFLLPVRNSSAFIPILTGTVTTGTLVYIAVQKKDDPVDCSFSLSHTAVMPTCNQSNGSIQIVADPAGAYEYVFSNGETTPSISNLQAGNYSVTVTQQGTTCQKTLTVSLTNASDYTISASTQNADCGTNNGGAQLSVQPAGAYSFQWSHGSTSQNQTNLPPGTYTVTVTNGMCEKTLSLEIETNPFEPSITYQTTQPDCGQSNGSIHAIVSPDGSYQYTWSHGATGALTENLPAGNYTVTVSVSDQSCSASAEITLSELAPAFSLTTTSTPTTCGSSDGTASVFTTIPGNYTFLWSDGQITAEAAQLSAGVYSVTVTLEGTSCSVTTDVEVTELPASFVLTTTSTPSQCGGADGTANVVSDQPGEYTIQWSDGQTTADAVNLLPGSYTVTVTLVGTDCSQTTQVTVDNLPASFMLTSSSTPSHCGKEEGTATIVADPPDNYTYIWSNGQSTPIASNLTPGIYIVTVSLSGSTCSLVVDVLVEQLPFDISVYTSTTLAGCGIANGSATIDSVVTSQSVSLSFLWSNGQTGPVATNLLPGTYTVEIFTQTGKCFGSYTDTVIVEQVQPNFTGTVTATPTACGLSQGSAFITIDPVDTYIYDWSNGQTGSQLTDVAAGNYSVTVTDVNSCTASFDVTIPSVPTDYFILNGTTNGNCTGDGEIAFTLTTPGLGPIILEVQTPSDVQTFSLTPGSFLLSSLLLVFPGTYTFIAYDEQAGIQCSQTLVVTIEDETPPLLPQNDMYFAQTGDVVEENALINDAGLGLQMNATQNVIGGSVQIDPDGSFSFIPFSGFVGDASFVYFVTDACGTTSSATVIITYENVECNFTIQSTVIAANCGIENGYINIEVNEPGSYSYFWDTGQSGSELEDLAFGEYTVTIHDAILDCEQEFTFNVGEYPAEYISNVVITQPTCGSSGDIQMTLSAPGPQGNLTLSISHPNGVDVFFVDPGLTLISDYIDVNPGNYTIEVFIENAGPECIESFSATLAPPPSLVILEEAVFPPSGPTADDGMAIIVIQPPFGEAPYSILVNGSVFGVSLDPIIEVMGLSVGTYTIQIIDAAGCESNLLIINIPLPDEVLSLGVVLGNIPFDASNTEQTSHGKYSWRTGMQLDFPLRLWQQNQRMEVQYFPPISTKRQSVPGYIQLKQVTEFVSFGKRKEWLAMEGGIGFQTPTSDFQPDVYGILQLNGNIPLKKGLCFQSGLTFQSSAQGTYVSCRSSLRIPFFQKKSF